MRLGSIDYFEEASRTAISCVPTEEWLPALYRAIQFMIAKTRKQYLFDLCFQANLVYALLLLRSIDCVSEEDVGRQVALTDEGAAAWGLRLLRNRGFEFSRYSSINSQPSSECFTMREESAMKTRGLAIQRLATSTLWPFFTQPSRSLWLFNTTLECNRKKERASKNSIDTQSFKQFRLFFDPVDMERPPPIMPSSFKKFARSQTVSRVDPHISTITGLVMDLTNCAVRSHREEGPLKPLLLSCSFLHYY